MPLSALPQQLIDSSPEPEGRQDGGAADGGSASVSAVGEPPRQRCSSKDDHDEADERGLEAEPKRVAEERMLNSGEELAGRGAEPERPDGNDQKAKHRQGEEQRSSIGTVSTEHLVPLIGLKSVPLEDGSSVGGL